MPKKEKGVFFLCILASPKIYDKLTSMCPCASIYFACVTKIAACSCEFRHAQGVDVTPSKLMNFKITTHSPLPSLRSLDVCDLTCTRLRPYEINVKNFQNHLALNNGVGNGVRSAPGGSGVHAEMRRLLISVRHAQFVNRLPFTNIYSFGRARAF